MKRLGSPFVGRAAGVALALAGAVLGHPPSARALSSEAGTSGAQFLKLGAGARAGAMAEAQIALANDAYSVYYNPAGLSRAARPMAAGMHNTHFEDIKYDFLAFSLPIGTLGEGARGALGAAVYNLSARDLEERTQDTDAAIGRFNASDSAYAVTYSHRLSESLGVGANVKYVRTKIHDVSAGALGVDVGAQYRMGLARPLDLGLVLRNVGSKLKFEQGSDPLPMTVGVGAAAEALPGLTLDLDLLKSRDTDISAALGAEYRRSMGEKFAGALRAGYTTRTKDIEGLKGLTAGAGLSFHGVAFDFAWVPFGELGHAFKYSLLVKF